MKTNTITMTDFSRAVFNYRREVIGYLNEKNHFVELDEHDAVEIPIRAINSIIGFVPDGLFLQETFRNEDDTRESS